MSSAAPAVKDDVSGHATVVRRAASTQTAVAHEYRRLELPRLRFWLLCVGLCLGLFLSFIDSSIVATSLFMIGSDFQDLQSVNWVALSYTLSYLGCAVLFARISDVIGRRNAFSIAYLLFFAFSIGCGFASTLNQLIACRAFQGLGGSGLYSITMIILLEVSPEAVKHHLAGIIGIVIAVGGVLGPVLGGILTQYARWPWVFWINGPIGAVSLVLFYTTWPKPEYLPDVERRAWAELDFAGSILLIAAAVLVVFAFQYAGGDAGSWTKATFLAPLIVGIVCWAALAAWELYVDRRWGDKMAAAFPLRLLRSRVYTAAILNAIFLGFPYILLVFNFPLRLQVVNRQSVLLAGVEMLPMLAASAIGSAVAGRINKDKDRICETLVVASILMTLGCGLLSTLSDSLPIEAKALGFVAFVGLGFGMSAAGSTMLATLYPSLRDHSVAQGMLAQVRILGGSIGLAASATILRAVLRSQLDGIVDTEQIVFVESDPDRFTEPQLAAIRHAYADAFTRNMRVCAIMTSIAVPLAMGTWSGERTLLKDRLQQQVKDEMERRKSVKASEATATTEPRAQADL